MVIASAAMLGSQRLPRANWKWEDLPKSEKTWARWKQLYKQEEALKRVRVLVTDGQDQFGAAHRATGTNVPPPPPSAPTGAPTGTTQGAQLDEYFDALAAASSTD